MLSNVIRQLGSRHLNNIKVLIHKLLLVLALTCACSALSAPQYQFNVLHTKDGLPSTLINEVFQQKNGFIWLATDRGASRYDGENFVHYSYSPGSDNHITNNFVVDILEDQHANIWLATEDGLNKISPEGTVTTYKSGQENSIGLDNGWLSSLFEDNNGTLWIGGSNDGVFAFDPTEQKFIKYRHESGNISSVGRITQAQNGDIYLAAGKGLAKVNKSTKTFNEVKSNDVTLVTEEFINNFLWQDEQHLWIATQFSGVKLFNIEQGKVVKVLNDTTTPRLRENSVFSLEQANKDEIWIGHEDKGISVYNLKTDKVHYIIGQDFNDFTLPANSISSIFKDESGLIWVATEDGLATHSPLQNALRVYNKKYDGSGLTHNYIYHISPGDNGTIWLATESGLSHLDLATDVITQHPIKFSSTEIADTQEVWNIINYSEQKLWLATASGLMLFDKVTGISEPLSIKQHPFQSELYTLMPASENRFWVTGYLDVGLQLIDPFADGSDKVIKRYFTDEKSRYFTGGNYAMSKIRSTSGDIWMATTDGIYRASPETDETFHYQLTSRQDNLRATGIVEVNYNEFWIATQGAGLVKLVFNEDTGEATTKAFNIQNGYPINEFNALVLDGDYLWLTSISGLHKFDISSEKLTSYPSLFHDPELTFAESGIKQLGALLLLGSNRGLMVVDTDMLRENFYQPPLALTDINAVGKSLLNNSQANKQSLVKLPYEQNDIEFAFAALDYTKPKNNRYLYQLVGFEESWNQPTEENKVSYNNLQPGDYIFKVRGTNSDGKWSENIAEYRFIISHPWWFYALNISAAIILLIIIFVLVSRRRYMKYLKMRAHRDSLTGLENRYSFNKKLEKELSLTEHSFALLLIDLDGFKEVNDSFGHSVGDAYLKQTAKIIRACIRPTDVAARLGGDEFAILILGDTHSDAITRIAQRIRDKLNKPIFAAEHKIVASGSIGIALFPDDARSSSTLLSKADNAMYAAKESGKNSVCYYNEELGIEINRKLKIRSYLKSAIENKEFELYYQPKINQLTGEITGAEALLRWEHPQEGFISPALFIPEAERNGTIIEIGQWVIEQACRQVVAWDKNCTSEFRVSINLSPLQMINDGFVSYVKTVLDITGADPSALEFEITETVFIECKEQCQEIIFQLKELGISIALDDFGSGFSSLSYLTEYSIDTLKIDRSLVSNIEHNKKNSIVLKNIYALAKELGLSVVAEGVETKAQLDRLKLFNGHIIQGFCYYPALKEQEFTPLLSKNIESIPATSTSV